MPSESVTSQLVAFCHQTNRSQKYVAIEREEMLERFYGKKPSLEVISSQTTIIDSSQDYGHEESPPLGDDRTQRHTFHREMTPEEQERHTLLLTNFQKILQHYDYYEIQPHINSKEQKIYNK